MIHIIPNIVHTGETRLMGSGVTVGYKIISLHTTNSGSFALVEISPSSRFCLGASKNQLIHFSNKYICAKKYHPKFNIHRFAIMLLLFYCIHTIKFTHFGSIYTIYVFCFVLLDLVITQLVKVNGKLKF